MKGPSVLEALQCLQPARASQTASLPMRVNMQKPKLQDHSSCHPAEPFKHHICAVAGPCTCTMFSGQLYTCRHMPVYSTGCSDLTTHRSAQSLGLLKAIDTRSMSQSETAPSRAGLCA